MNASKSARSWGASPFSSPSGIRERPVDATASICDRGTTSITPSAH